MSEWELEEVIRQFSNPHVLQTIQGQYVLIDVINNRTQIFTSDDTH
jgi:hypothetical protein